MSDKRIYGYARVSSREQNLERQLQALKDAGVEERNILVDKQSGKDFNREAYKALTMQLLREGDLLIIMSIDRLGRNYAEMRDQWDYITKKIGADIKVLDMPLLDTSNSTDNLDSRFLADLVLQILSYVAEKERENTRKRQRQGIDVMPVKDGKRYSSRTGRPTGRPPVEYPDQWKNVYEQWKAKRITAVQAMENLRLKKNSFYKLVKQYEISQSWNIEEYRTQSLIKH